MTINLPVQVNGTTGDAVIIRRYTVESGVRVYTTIAKILFDGSVMTLGELKEQQQVSEI